MSDQEQTSIADRLDSRGFQDGVQTIGGRSRSGRLKERGRERDRHDGNAVVLATSCRERRHDQPEGQ